MSNTTDTTKRTMEDYFNEFLLTILNSTNGALVNELKLRWKEYCNTPLVTLNTKDTGKEYKESWAGQQEKVKEEKMKELAKKIYSEQPTNDNAFVWTDALVMEIIGLTHRAGYHKEPARVYERIQSFKQSKQSAPPIVKDKEVIWFVNQYWELHSKIKDTHHPADNDKNITVKDKEAGEQYILENKPCLSLKDLFLLGITEHHPYYKMLSELVKQKLSK